MKAGSNKTFLKAEWRKLLMANYTVPPEVLAPYLPYKTELDLWNNVCYVSLVGFMFLNTRLKGIRIPFHTNFAEVNLRFYVRYNDNCQCKRGVVFIKEIVAKPALAFVANTLYKENYETLPMRHFDQVSERQVVVEYGWKKQNIWNSLRVNTNTEQIEIDAGSEAEFITEHFWGYTKLNQGATSEYGVEHPSWKLYTTTGHEIDVNFGLTYGKHFSFLDQQEPVSVFLAEGSEIEVKTGRII